MNENAEIDRLVAENEALKVRIEELHREDHLVTVTFKPVVKATEKGPRWRYTLALQGAMRGTVNSGPVFVKDGVARPIIASIYGDDAIQVAQIQEVFNGHVFHRNDPDGEAALLVLPNRLQEAFTRYRDSGFKKPVQVISLQS